ncbi:Hsp20/alpha crystallin family protein [Streptomyces sp. NPDC052676]|uniref:Hsp20/alpha crystallin family protein n=1 Tax=Streptomyces sp. NPDC052676 TaxID=3154953 RepID=UPI0034254D91
MNTPARRGGGPLEPRRGPGWGGGPWDWDPLAELRRLWRDMDRAVDRSTPAWGGVAWVPAVEEDETDDAYEIRAELPGVPRERITVDVDEHELRISGDLGEAEGRALSRRGGRFFYRTSLPTGADPDRAEAELTDGVLRVRLPKTAAPKRRRLRIGGTDAGTERAADGAARHGTERSVGRGARHGTERAHRGTDQATREATEQATEAVTERATREVTDQAGREVTEQATARTTAREADRATDRTGADT